MNCSEQPRTTVNETDTETESGPPTWTVPRDYGVGCGL